MQSRVRFDVDFASKSEILNIIGCELQVVTKILPHIDRVFDIESIEAYGIFPNRAGEGVLEQTYLVVVNIHISEDILEHGIEDVSRFY